MILLIAQTKILTYTAQSMRFSRQLAVHKIHLRFENSKKFVTKKIDYYVVSLINDTTMII